MFHVINTKDTNVDLVFHVINTKDSIVDLLSGGLDSSLLVGLLHEAGHQNIRSFSIGFEDIDDEAGSEFEYSDQIVKQFNTISPLSPL